MTAGLIVADAGPLIGLATAGHVSILRAVFERVLVPKAVFEELQVDASRPGSVALAGAVQEGWLSTAQAPESTDVETLAELVDRGEAEAIVLAQSLKTRLLIDDKQGRAAARRRGVTVIGTGGILLLAKRSGAIDRITPILDALASGGYRLSGELRTEVLRLADEA